MKKGNKERRLLESRPGQYPLPLLGSSHLDQLSQSHQADGVDEVDEDVVDGGEGFKSTGRLEANQLDEPASGVGISRLKVAVGRKEVEEHGVEGRDARVVHESLNPVVVALRQMRMRVYLRNLAIIITNNIIVWKS